MKSGQSSVGAEKQARDILKKYTLRFYTKQSECKGVGNFTTSLVAEVSWEDTGKSFSLADIQDLAKKLVSDYSH